MHVPQSIEAETEISLLASVLRQIVSPRENAPIIQLFQDTMTGSFRMTNPAVQIPEHVALNMMSRLKRPMSLFKKTGATHTGPSIFSAALPLMDFKEGSVKIENGALKEGILKKGAFGGASKGILHVVYNDFGPDRCGQLINEIQQVVTKFNLYSGFSVGTSDLVANPETTQFVEQSLREGREAVKQLLTDVHAGRFVNTSGRTNGDELENQIVNKLKEISAKISKKVMDTLPKENRMIQMVAAGTKGSDLNIQQMIALLGQQIIDGRRVKYTLQERTLPHFAKYDDGVESRGFVQNSFVGGLRPEEYFYHAQGGREGLIDTAVKTSDTGYIQRRMMKIMEDYAVAYDRTVRKSDGTIVQYAYGEDGVDSVCVEEQPCNLALMPLEEVYREFALSKDDVDAVCAESVSEYPDLIDEILKDRDMLVKDVFRDRKNDMILAPVHLKRLCERYRNKYSTKTDLTPTYVVDELGRLMKEPWLAGNKVFHLLLRFYLAPKKSIVAYRFTKEMFDELVKEIRFRTIKSLVHPGEMVGALAAQSIGEPTTQLTLNSIAHHERVWVRKGQDIRVVQIGEFVQEWIAKSEKLEHHPNHTTLAYLPAGWETLSVDEHGKVEWKKLEAVTQHPPVNEDGSNTLVQIRTKGGRTVLATKAKSFLTKGEKGELVPTRGDELTIGSEVPLMAEFPVGEQKTILVVSDYIADGFKDRLPTEIALDKTFGRFVGAYIAEGMANDHVVAISNNDPTYREKAMEWVTRVGLKYRVVEQKNKIKEGWTSTDCIIHCTQLARLMKTICGRGSLNKRVPDLAYNAPLEFVVGLLEGYLSGDGTVGVNGRRCISFTSISENLVDGVNALLARLGVHARKSAEMTQKNTPFKAHTFWFSRIPVNECIVLRECVELMVPSKQERLMAMEPTKIVCKRSDFGRQNDVVWDTVVAIEDTPCPTPFVYDLTVEDTRNFVHANGLCLRDTFHSAGTVKAGATQGVPRIQELLELAREPKNPLTFVYLKPELATGTIEQVILVKREIQKTTLRDITKSVRIYYDPYPLEPQTVVEEDRPILETFQEFSTGNPACVSKWVMRLEMDRTEMAARGMQDMTIIQNALLGNSAVRIAQCVVSDANSGKLVTRITFDDAFAKNVLALRYVEDRILDTVISGVEGVGRVYHRDVQNELIWDDAVGGYTAKKQHVLDVEGANLFNLLGARNVDSTRTFSNSIHEVMEVFGIEAARQAIYDEFNEVFSSAYVNYHHMSVLLDAMTYQGRLVSVNRFGMSKQDNGVLAQSSFEETSKILFNAATGALFDNMQGVSANIMFGQKPPCGTGIVDIVLDETRLPEGTPDEEYTLQQTDLKMARDRIARVPAEGPDCRMEDILMEW